MNDISSWRNLKLRPKTRELLEIVATTAHQPFVKAIMLFGSEARGEARLTSDVDLALISTEPLTMKERLSILENVPQDLYCDVDVRVTGLKETSLNTTNKLDVGYSVKREGVTIYENLHGKADLNFDDERTGVSVERNKEAESGVGYTG